MLLGGEAVRDFVFFSLFYNGVSCTKNLSVTEILGSASDAAATLLYFVTAFLCNNVFLKAINKSWGRQGSGSMSFSTHVTVLNRDSWYTAASFVLPGILKHTSDYVIHSLSSPLPLFPPSLLLHCLAHDLMQHNPVRTIIACQKNKREHFLQIRYFLSIWGKKPVPNVLWSLDCWQRILIYHAKTILSSHMLNNKNVNGTLVVRLFYFTWKQQYHSNPA